MYIALEGYASLPTFTLSHDLNLGLSQLEQSSTEACGSAAQKRQVKALPGSAHRESFEPTPIRAHSFEMANASRSDI